MVSQRPGEKAFRVGAVGVAAFVDGLALRHAALVVGSGRADRWAASLLASTVV